MHTGCGHVDGLRIVLGGEGLAFHLRVVPERSLQSFLTVGRRTFCGQMALHHTIVGEVATWQIDQLLLFGLDTIEDGHCVVGCTVIVTPHHRLVVGIRTYHGNLLRILLQGQDITFVL